LEKLAFKQARRRDKRGWGKWQGERTGEVEVVRGKNEGENNVTSYNVVDPMRRILPGGINSFIHSFIHSVDPRVDSVEWIATLIIVQFILDLDTRGFPPACVTAMHYLSVSAGLITSSRAIKSLRCAFFVNMTIREPNAKIQLLFAIGLRL
jgi:hypothetical protein